MLDLEAKTKPQELIKAYLEKNATETLIEKINNGVRIVKDDKQLLSKKTLDGFMKYATEEARKLAEQGANSACIEDNIVYGWAMHFFEEDSIEGNLYNLDGTEYKPTKKGVKQPSKTAITHTPSTVKKKPTTDQLSFFDMITVEEQEPKGAVNEKPTADEIFEYNVDDEHDDEIENETKIEQPSHKLSPTYERYLELQKQNPTAVVIMRLGDFYEVFGDNAIQLADELNMIPTSRDFGCPERIPIIGFPCHAADAYFLKIIAKHDMLVCEADGETTFLPMSPKKTESEKHWLDEKTYVDDDGVVHKVKPDIPDWILSIFNNKVIAR